MPYTYSAGRVLSYSDFGVSPVVVHLPVQHHHHHSPINGHRKLFWKYKKSDLPIKSDIIGQALQFLRRLHFTIYDGDLVKCIRLKEVADLVSGFKEI